MRSFLFVAFLCAVQCFQIHPSPLAASRCALRASSAPLLMADEAPEESSAVEEVPAAQAAGAYETFYDDEREDAVLAQKPEISNSMRDRLIKESRGLGADPNAKNPFLPVFFGVGVFVILGALAVNM